MKRIIVVWVLVCLLPLNALAQEQKTVTPEDVVGTYSTTYYASFSDWDIFPVLLPILNADTRLMYEERFDLRPEAQIIGIIRGSTERGDYRINLPEVPTNSGWFDTDGDPNTPSSVKVFVAGIGNGLVSEEYVSRYDFIYTRSFNYDPNTHLWSGKLLAWTDQANTRLPVLPGEDRVFYTSDDQGVTLPAGWSTLEVTPDAATGQHTIIVTQDLRPVLPLNEPKQFENVDLSNLSYADAFNELLTALERTYIFTDYRHVDWQDLRETYGKKAGLVENSTQYQTLLQTALFSFRDGHLAILGPGVPEWYWGRLGIRVYPVEGELMVIEVAQPSPAANQNIIPGTVITTVNQANAMDFFNTIPRAVYSSGHTTQDLWFKGNLAFRGNPGTTFDITYRSPDGSLGASTLTTLPADQIGDTGFALFQQPLSYQMLDNNIGYIAIYNFTSGSVDDLWDEAINYLLANNAQGLVIDLRNNGGGFSAISNYMLGDFLDEDMYSGEEISSLDEDGDGITDTHPEYYFGRARRFDPANVAVLIGPYCFSACEFAAEGFQDIGATVIGHLPSGGAGGGVGASYFLPGGTRVYGMAVVMSINPDGNIRVEGTGVNLNVQVPFTAQGLASGEDMVLSAAEAFLLGN